MPVVVRVEARLSYWALIVSSISCNACDGERQLRDVDGFYSWCNRCQGLGVLSSDAEAKHLTFVREWARILLPDGACWRDL